MFGYMLISSVETKALIAKSISVRTINEIGLNQLVQQFWVTEEPLMKTKTTTEEIECKNHYKSQVSC